MKVALVLAQWSTLLLVVTVFLSMMLLLVMGARQGRQLHGMAVRARRAERERIARDLHDTILQAVQALLLHLQGWSADKNLPDDRRREIASVAEQARTAVNEGRKRIQALRQVERYDHQIREQLVGLCQNSAGAPRYVVDVVGAARILTPETYDTVIEIAGEAVRNAYAHAQACSIGLTLIYGRSGLILDVSDDGRGIVSKAIDSGVASSRFGLLGMRERAAQLGARLEVGASPLGGCRVKLFVPPGIAFVSEAVAVSTLRGVVAMSHRDRAAQE